MDGTIMQSKKITIKTFDPAVSKAESIKKVGKVGFINRFIGKGKIKQLRGIDSKLIYYPFWFIVFRVEIYRIAKLPSRISIVPIAVDGVKGGAGLLDTKPELFVNKEIEERRLIPNTINSDQATKIGYSFCKTYVERRFHPYKPPTYNVKNIELVYPPFYAVKSLSKESNQSYLVLVNAISGVIKQREEIT